MSKWEKLKKSYITRFPPTQNEEKTIPVCFKETFAAAKLRTRTLFANFEEPVWVTKAHATWKYVSTNEDVDISEIIGWFPYYQQLENLDPYSGTAYFDGKHIYYSTYSHKWNYVTVVSTGTWGLRVRSDRGKLWEPAHHCTITCDCCCLVTFHCRLAGSITSSCSTWVIVRLQVLLS